MENSKIGWTHHTFNPWEGCTKVSPACDHCYAERDRAHRRKTVVWGAGQPRRRMKTTWSKPPRWNREAEKNGVRYKVFCASLADVFDGETVSDLNAWRKDLWKLIEDTPNLYWLLLTKRPQNIRRMVPSHWMNRFPEHVWIGASAENQAMLELRAPIIASLPATVRFLSCEPLLSHLDLGPYLGDHDCHACNKRFWGDDLRAPHLKSVDFTDHGGESALDTCPYCGYDNTDEEDATVGFDNLEPTINWVIAGGESGPSFRPVNMSWLRSIRDQCSAANVPFFLKQFSGMRPETEPELDGKRWVECPEQRLLVSA